MSRRLRFFLWLGLYADVHRDPDGDSYGAVRPTTLGWIVASLLGLWPQKIAWDVETPCDCEEHVR